MRNILKRNKYLKGLVKLYKGFTPVYLEYAVNFKPRWQNDGGNPHLAKVIKAADTDYRRNLKSIASLKPIVSAINEKKFPFSIDWHNHHTPALDGFSIMWAALGAKQLFLEIGSGTSTLFAKAALTFENKETQIISIDPSPRLEVDSICDELYRMPLEDIDLSVFDRLGRGDVLYVDNSHRSFMNSDVTTFMLDVLPRLKQGVLIGIHDIFLPHDYYSSWVDRAYNEQYLLASYLLANPSYFNIQLANYWISLNKLHHEPLQNIWPMFEAKIRDRHSSAFWAIKN